MSGDIRKLIPTFMVLIFILVGYVYGVGILSSSSQDVNVTGTEFEESYNTTQQQQSATLWMIFPIALALTAVFVLGAFKYLTK